MARTNAILNHPEAATIDRAILADHESLKVLATRFNVSAHSLSRRKKALSATAEAENDPDALERQAAMWRERADTLWHTATADADVRGQAAAIAAGLRSCELMAQQAKQAAANPSPVGTGTPVTIELIDSIVHSELSKTERGRNENRLYSAPDRVLRLAVKLLDHPGSWDDVEHILETTQVN